MKKTEENIEVCEEILKELKFSNAGGVVTWDGEHLALWGRDVPLHSFELELCSSLECFGDPEHWTKAEHIFEFIRDYCNPTGGLIDASFKIEGGRTHDEVCLVLRDAEMAPREGGECVEYDNEHLLIETLFDRYGVGEYGCNDDEAWIWLDPEEAESYPMDARFYYTQAETNSGIEWKADIA